MLLHVFASQNKFKSVHVGPSFCVLHWTHILISLTIKVVIVTLWLHLTYFMQNYTCNTTFSSSSSYYYYYILKKNTV